MNIKDVIKDNFVKFSHACEGNPEDWNRWL